MDISVIMPVYNAEKFVKYAIESVLNQSFKGLFELVIINDCSTDNTRMVISEFENNPKIKILNNAKNLGYPMSMNLGFANVCGKYIVRMDADDVMHYNLLDIEFKLINDNPNVAFVSCRRFFLTFSGIFYHFDYKIKDELICEDINSIMEKIRYFNDVGTMFLFEIAKRVGFYNTYQRSGMDVDFWLKIYEYSNQKSITVNKPLIGKRHLPDSIIFRRNTSEINNIPRMVSEYRRKYNLNVISLPDEKWFEEMKIKIDNGGVNLNLNMIAHVSKINFKFFDFRGGLKFFLFGFYRGNFRFTYLFLRELFKNSSNYSKGYP
jgi:glycosyltransferase involved in cell wall biosynthesis